MDRLNEYFMIIVNQFWKWVCLYPDHIKSVTGLNTRFSNQNYSYLGSALGAVLLVLFHLIVTTLLSFVVIVISACAHYIPFIIVVVISCATFIVGYFKWTKENK